MLSVGKKSWADLVEEEESAAAAPRNPGRCVLAGEHPGGPGPRDGSGAAIDRCRIFVFDVGRAVVAVEWRPAK